MQKEASLISYFYLKMKAIDLFYGIILLLLIFLQSTQSYSQVETYEDRYNLGNISPSVSHVEVFFFNSTSQVINKIEQVNGELSFTIGSDLNLMPGQYIKLKLPIIHSGKRSFNQTFSLMVNDDSNINIELKGKFSNQKTSDQDCPDFKNGGTAKRNKPNKNIKKLQKGQPSINVQLIDKNRTGVNALNEKTFKNNNLILLVDASSSMLDDRKKEFVDEAFNGLAEILRPSDQITVMAYSDDAQIVFSTAKEVEYSKLIKSIKSIKKKGVTNGSKGIEKAYVLADSIFMSGGNNEIILITDGAFNANETDAISEKIISQYVSSGIRLSIIGIENQNWAAKEMKELTKVGNGTYTSVKSVRSAKSAIKRTVKNHARK